MVCIFAGSSNMEDETEDLRAMERYWAQTGSGERNFNNVWQMPVLPT